MTEMVAARAAFLVTGLIGVEGVRVFHQELATAEQAGARPRLVAELGLHLVQVLRQVAVAPDIATNHVRDDLFVSGA